MNQIKLQVPIHVNFLSEWADMDSYLSQGASILDKGRCGCGGTEYYLRNDKPVIMLSPRIALIKSKLISNHNRKHPLYYFDRTTSNDIKSSLDGLEHYIQNPFQSADFVPKIIVTFDSAIYVMGKLKEIGCIDAFTILVDEFQVLFTDSPLKGFKMLSLIEELQKLSNHIVYMSATPIDVGYLSNLQQLSQVDYYKLEWDPSSYRNVTVFGKKMKNPATEIERIVTEYRDKGYFMAKDHNGEIAYSKEAYFYLNEVQQIIKAIKKCNLKPEDTLIVCSDIENNRKRLKDIMLGDGKRYDYDIGYFASEDDYKSMNKPFNFVTGTCFYGADLYSDNGTTYIFSSPNSKKHNMSLDMSLEVPQIVGRCRTPGNPFNDEMSLFYTISSQEFIEQFEKDIQARENRTAQVLPNYSQIVDWYSLQKLITAQNCDKYAYDYVDAIRRSETEGVAVKNDLVYWNDIMRLKVKKEQYQSRQTISTFLAKSGYHLQSQPHKNPNPEFLAFYEEFIKDNDFKRKMELIVETIKTKPQLKDEIFGCQHIDFKYKEYYMILGPVKIQSLKYRENMIRLESSCAGQCDRIKQRLMELLKQGERYSNKTLKSILTQVYQEFGFHQLTPSAIDITYYLNATEESWYEGGKRIFGYRI